MKNKLKFVGLVAVLLVMVVAVASASSGPQPGDLTVVGTPTIAGDIEVVQPKDATGPGRYIVQLEDEPVATYRGGVEGLAPTSPAALGQDKIDLSSAAAEAYVQYLDKQQAAFVSAASVAVARPVEVAFQYKFAVNGVVMELTPEEAAAVAKLPGVKYIERDVAMPLATDAGPEWIGAPAIWDGSATPNDTGTLGEGVIVGVIDSGINMTHPSFAETGADGYTVQNPYGDGNFVGWCNPDHPNYRPEFVCNNKLIGAWDFADDLTDDDDDGPIDNDGHGSHTASTAAGNFVEAEVYAPTTVVSRMISGVAPHANVIAYDVCGLEIGCFNSSTVAAVEQAIQDGVDVLNESISIGGDVYFGAKQQAYLGAYAAGIVYSRSAGNSGPAPMTVGPEPVWTMSVGASTHNRVFVNSLTDMTSDGGPLADIVGVGFTAGYGPAPIVYAGDFENPNDPGGDPAQCLEPFPAGTFDGEIVVCDRGTIARVDKGANALAGGAGGFVLANVPANGESITGDAHFLPGVHIGAADAVVLREWLANNENTVATISGVDVDLNPANGDIMADFSSRGPGEVDVLKPDVTAPGVDILAAVNDEDGITPDGEPEYGFLSGTSMSSPHNAGSAALLVALYPDWSPSQIRSALMTSAIYEGVAKEDAASPADPFDFGAGRVDLTKAGQVGLVLDVTVSEFIASNPALGGDPKDLNLASMQDSNCYQSCSWSRTVMNPTSMRMTWEATYVGPGTAMVAPSMFTVRGGQSATFDLEVNVLAVAPEMWHFGRVVWSEVDGKAPDVTMPVAFYVKSSTDVDSLTKNVSSTAVANGEIVEYTIEVQNTSTAPATFNLVDPLPENATYVEGSVTGGLTYNQFADGSELLSWSGELGPSGIALTPDLVIGYLSLSSLGVPPFQLPSNCDDGGFLITGLDMVYLGQSYDNAIWSVNGTIEPGSASGLLASASNTSLPSPTPPNNLIAPWWTDLNLCDGGNWYLAGLTDGVNDFTVFEWENVPRFDDLDSRATFQIWILDGTDLVWFAYPENAFTGDTTDGTIGVENSDGTAGAQLYFDGDGTLPDGSADYVIDFFQSDPAVLTYQVVANGDLLNEATLTGGPETVTAWAFTEVVNFTSYLPVIPIQGSEPALPTIAEIAQSNEDFSTLAAALELTGLDAPLDEQGPYTVFAPTNAAFDALPDGVLDDLLADPDALAEVLLYHVVPGSFFAEDVVTFDFLTTLLGQDIQIEVTDAGVILNGEAMVTVTDVAASNGVVHVIDAVLIPEPTPPTITEIVNANEDFSTLGVALEITGLDALLDAPGTYTVFAPTNAAFEALPDGVLDALVNDPDTLSGVLAYHAAGEVLFAADVVALDSITTLNGQDITVEVIDGNVVLNGVAMVVTPDIEASNGVVHVIDAVLIPPEPTIETLVLNEPEFSTLAAAIEIAGLEGVLAGAGPFTVFAPPNAAFDALPDGVLDDLLADPDALAEVLLYHVAPEFLSAAQVAALDSITTAQGEDISVAVVDGNVVLNDSSTVVQTDVIATNGIIHVVDAVLIPPSMMP